MSTQATPTTELVHAPTADRKSVMLSFATEYGLEPAKVMSIVTETIFRGGREEPPLTPAEVAAALIVCNAYNLNPFTKEVYAFRSKGKLLIVVGVDGWSTIVNRQPQLNGIEFEEHFDEQGAIQAVTCKIHRKDRALPVIVTEYTRECFRDTDPWRKMPIRMTRNRAFVQCARIAFSISGIVDDDEAGTIEGAPMLAGPSTLALESGASRTENVKAAIAHAKGQQKKKEAPAPQQEADTAPAQASATAVDPGDVEQEPAQQQPAQDAQQQGGDENW